jgi:hypothetical protein
MRAAVRRAVGLILRAEDELAEAGRRDRQRLPPARPPGVDPRGGEAPGGVAGPLVVGASHAVFELREPDDSSVRTAAIPSRCDLGHRTRRRANRRCEVGRVHPLVVTIEGYDDAPQRPALLPCTRAWTAPVHGSPVSQTATPSARASRAARPSPTP